MSKYLIKYNSGSIGITQVIKGTIEEAINKWVSSVQLSVVSYRPITDIDIPLSREFRNAWCDISPSSKIDIHAGKVRDILLDNVRKERSKKLETLDKDFIIALENNDQVKLGQIKTEKNRLRDITTPLKNLTVAELATDEDIAYMKSLVVL